MLAVYDYSPWQRYLASWLFPAARRIPAVLPDQAGRALETLAAGTAAFLFHVDLTHAGGAPVDRDALVGALRARGVTVLNERVVDVSKRALHSACRAAGIAGVAAERDGPPDERVIVKSDRNYGGLPELRAAGRASWIEAPPEPRPRDPAVVPRYPSYRVCSRYKVPDAVWEDAGLVVERYVGNRFGRAYRAFVLLGALAVQAIDSPHDVKRIPGRCKYVLPDDEVPAELRRTLDAYLRESGLDFGAVDFVCDDDGAFYVIDVTGTPVWGDRPPDCLASRLAPGRLAADACPGTP